MSYNQNQGGYQQPNQQGYQNTKAPRKEKINEWTGVGIVRPRSANENDAITFYPFKTEGEGGINFNLKITENTGTSDENGNPRLRHTTVPVSVRTNKSITAAQLQAVVSGMKVRIVGRLELQSYKSKQTGNDVTKLVVSAYVFEVIEMPMQQPAPAFNAPQYAPQYVQGGYIPQQQQMQQGYQQPQYPPQYGQQGYMPLQQPQQPYQPAYAQPAPPQQGGYAPRQAMPQNGQVPPQAPPAYYQPPQGVDQIEDLPIGM